MKIRSVANGSGGSTPSRSLLQSIQPRQVAASTKPVPAPTLAVREDGTITIVADEISLSTPVYAGQSVDTPTGKAWQKDTSAPIGLHLFGSGQGRGGGLKLEGYAVTDPVTKQTMRGRLVVRVDARWYPNA